jgi:predicted Zn-dependent peptidase
MTKLMRFLVVAFVALLTMAACSKYESVKNDPMKTRIYTLDNGLKVYMTVNTDEPRIQTYVAVRVGGKNDPRETTGLAHYFEHLMFKGTSKFGTMDFDKEKPMLDEIEALFEVYRKTTDEDQRTAIYKQIDSISQEASKIAIPNEYDKLMSAIGSEGTNAFTSYDVTAYVENIPSNQLENWAKIQADRFEDPIIRLFHTELETVYEEKNMSLTNDARKMYDGTLAALFPHHTYGTQTVLGTQEHLKNPSITNIKNYFKQYYVASNMAIIMAGDFNPDEAIMVIEKYFGKLPKGDVKPLKHDKEEPITEPIIKEIWGNDAENIRIAYRFPGANSNDVELLEIIDYLLNNGKAGLIDLNINQQQRTLSASAGLMTMADYSVFILNGRPKQGQTLDQVKDILLEQIELLKKGDFEDWLIEATINNFKLYQIQQLQSNYVRAMTLLNSFVYDMPWEKQVTLLDRQSKFTKKDVVDFANKYFSENYAVIYKRQGEDNDVKKIDKPQITPIATNRNTESDYLRAIKDIKVTPIEPVFLDYSKDLNQASVKNIPLLYKENTTNELFELNYVFDMGNNNDKALGTAFSYLNYLGTSTLSPEDIKSEFYKIACSYRVSSSSERVYVSLNGLNENFEKALALLEDLLADLQINEAAFTNLILDINKERTNAKMNQNRIYAMLSNYATWGPKSSATNILSSAELQALKPTELTQRIKDLSGYEHKILYYGPLKEDKVASILKDVHKTPEVLKPVPAPVKFTQADTQKDLVLFAHYNAKQLNMGMHYKGVKYDKSIEPVRRMYNEYFGGGMNAIVFQEMREARGLAYSAQGTYRGVSDPDQHYSIYTFIATQNDKMTDAVNAFKDILNNLPESDKAFDLAKDGIISSIRTERILRSSVLWNFLNAQKFGYTYDSRKDLYEKIPGFTFADIKAFQEQYIKDKPYVYTILGDKKDVNFNAMKKFGTIKELSLEEIFGY